MNNSIQSVIALFAGYNTKYKMTKCVDTNTLVQNGVMTSNHLNADYSTTINPDIVDALASLGLFSLLENDINLLSLEERLENIKIGIFAARRKGNDTISAPTIPESIDQLSIEAISAIVGDKKTQVQLSVSDLKKFGMLDRLNATHKASLQKSIDLNIENAERVKALFEMFKIGIATIKEESDESVVFACSVSASHWNSVLTKIRSSSERGWSVDKDSLALDDSMLNFNFELVLDKAVNPVAE